MGKELGKILVIDDNEDVLLAAKMLLKKKADYGHIKVINDQDYD